MLGHIVGLIFVGTESVALDLEEESRVICQEGKKAKPGDLTFRGSKIMLRMIIMMMAA